MKLISVPEASKLSGVPERTIYLKIEQGILKKYGENKIQVDYHAVLELVPIVIVLYNLKGGIGKTTISALLSFYFAEKNKKVLMLDLDPQQNLSICYESYDNSKPSIYNFMDKFSIFENKKKLLENTIQQVQENIDLIPASIELVNKHDIHVEDATRMKETFYDIFQRYQVVIVDCPPNFTGLSKLGLLLGNYIMMPVLSEAFSYEGITLALSKMNDIIRFNTDIKGYKVFLNRVKSKESSAKILVEEKFRDKLGNNLFNKVFPEYSMIDEIHLTKKNLFKVYKSKRQTKEIFELFTEIENYIYEVNDE